MNEKEVIYIAGFFDGEGSVGIKRDRPRGKMKWPHYGLWVSVVNTNEDIITWLNSLFGGSILKVVSVHKNGKLLHRLTLCPKKALLLLRTIEPYVRVKKPQVELALLFVGTVGWERDAKGRNKGKSPELRAKQERIFSEMAELNRRGTVRPHVEGYYKSIGQVTG